MRLPDSPYFRPDAGLLGLTRQLESLWRQLAQQVNQLSEGSIVAAYTAATAPPTAGSYVQGDFIRNSAPTELGTAGSKYVVLGWVNVATGTPGTWVQARALTGN